MRRPLTGCPKRWLHVEAVVPPEVAHLVLGGVPQQPHPGLGHVQRLGLAHAQGLHLLDVGQVGPHVLNTPQLDNIYTLSVDIDNHIRQAEEKQ